MGVVVEGVVDGIEEHDREERVESWRWGSRRNRGRDEGDKGEKGSDKYPMAQQLDLRTSYFQTVLKLDFMYF